MCAGEAPTGLLGESLFEREIIEFHSTFSRHGNAQASLTLLIWLNEKVQKLNSKLFALRAENIIRTESIVIHVIVH